MSFKAAWFSCVNTNGENIGIYTAKRLGAKVLISQGDNPYMQQSSASYGVTRSALDKDSTVADFTNSYAQMHNAPAVQSVQGSQYDYYMMPDDHEWGGDNWDHTSTQANKSGNSISAATQADVDTHWYRGIQAFQAAVTSYADNATNSDAEAIAEKPSDHERASLATFGVITAAASQYPVIYFRVGYDINGNIDNTNPHVEFFFIDCMSYRSATASTDNSSKTMLGANQKNWLKTYLSASAATFKVIVSGKKTYNATADNSDTWGFYTTERDELLAYIDTNSITGLFWIAGDKHHPHVISTEKPGDTYDHLCVVACPVGVDTNSLVLENEIVWTHDDKVIGLLDVQQGYVELSVRKNSDGKVFWRGRVASGENKVSYPALQAAI